MNISSRGSEDFRAANDANLKISGLGGKGKAAFHRISSLDMPFQRHPAICRRIPRPDMTKHAVSDNRRSC